MNNRVRKLLPSLGVLIVIVVVGIYLLAHYLIQTAGRNHVLAEISHPNTCNLLQVNDFLGWSLPQYEIVYKNSKASKNQSICIVYLKDGSDIYQGVVTLNYNYFKSNENFGNPYTENNNPAYFATFQNGFYTGNVVLEPAGTVATNESKALSGIIAVSAEINLPKNNGIQAYR